jgi:hypothetical protein
VVDKGFFKAHAVNMRLRTMSSDVSMGHRITTFAQRATAMYQLIGIDSTISA